MTNEEKQLLLVDLCARLPYWPKVKNEDDDDAYIVGLDDTEKGLFYVHILEDGDSYDTTMSVEDFKPYLRSLSSMTNEERKEFESFIFTQHHEWDGHGTSTKYVEIDDIERYVTWLNKKGFDYRGLIPMGLALEAPEGLYKTS